MNLIQLTSPDGSPLYLSRYSDVKSIRLHEDVTLINIQVGSSFSLGSTYVSTYKALETPEYVAQLFGYRSEDAVSESAPDA